MLVFALAEGLLLVAGGVDGAWPSLLRAALVKVKTLALDATASSFDATRDGLAAVCAPFAETVSRNNASSSSSAAASVADALHAPLRWLGAPPARCARA